MKKIIVITVLIVFALSSGLSAVEKAENDTTQLKTKADSKKTDKERKLYNNFTDQNKNGIDDRAEKKQRDNTYVKPKRSPDKIEKYQPKTIKTKDTINTDSKKTTEKVKKTEQK